MAITRRDFLAASLGSSTLVALGGGVPAFLARTTQAATANRDARDTVLVVVQLSGGNDGLNTVVPFADDAYHKARPVIGLKPADVLKINDTIGLHPKLAGLKGLYDDGHLGIIQGVGYPNPDRSHFRSTDIWQTATDADQYENHGWIGKILRQLLPGRGPHRRRRHRERNADGLRRAEPQGHRIRPARFAPLVRRARRR